MILIVGLGNPGKEYAGTRHNVGFQVLDQVAEKLGCSFRETRSKALVADYFTPETRIILAKPQTFVNLSGDSVKTIFEWFKLSLANVLVIHDDLDVPFGEIRFKEGGGSGGHNGLNSIIEKLGSEDFRRLRIGIGRPPGRKDPAEFVLEPFKAKEREEIDVAIGEAADTALDIAEKGE